MISYSFTLSLEQPFNKKSLLKLQTSLANAGIYLDLSWKDEMPQLTISLSEEFLEKSEETTTTSTPNDTDALPATIAPEGSKRRGRPLVQPKKDVTLGRVKHMRFLQVPDKTIADEIGVSKRTLYRRLNQINGKGLNDDTPFSQWI
jgi:hypothetical protein